jgi:hypothetical protein
VIPHPLYSHDLAPCDFFLFPKMKLWLTGHRFDTTEEIHAELQEVIDTLTFENFKGYMLGSLYTCPRELLQRGRWKLGIMVRNFFFYGHFPEVLGSTMCIYIVGGFSVLHFSCKINYKQNHDLFSSQQAAATYYSYSALC